ncbi:SRPBCC domain-containing protein [Actinophytocola sp.]|uniref:SRPBCC domain-containing protein n=1 Tax=Actinophytocola sp. TaxID=1872138 RepID=UPI002D80A236|nr:SRPBCC domain-containing protein [Actinophytocola sp.]HET9138240.1 SRPBCC domain-containing protein [Actinophytocola sp.]
MSGSAQTYHVFIRAGAQAVWDGITRPEHSAGYLFGALVDTTGQIGSPFRYHAPDRSRLWGDDTVLDADPPHRLVISYRGLYDPDLAAEPASRVSWLIEPGADGVTLLTVVHDQLDTAPRTAARVAGTGWMRVLSGLKTVLETGAGMTDAHPTAAAQR